MPKCLKIQCPVETKHKNGTNSDPTEDARLYERMKQAQRENKMTWLAVKKSEYFRRMSGEYENKNRPVLPGDSASCDSLQEKGDDPTGFEPLAKTPGKSGFSVLGGANSGAFPPDLQKLMSLWRRLSMAERSAVLAKVRALASGKREVGKAGCEGRLGSRQCPRKTPPASNGELP